MFDPSIISDLERLFAAPPAFFSPPAISRPYAIPLSATVTSQLERIVRFYEQYMAGFHGQVSQMRELVSDQIANKSAGPEDIATFTVLIELLEDFAEDRAKTSARQRKDRYSRNKGRDPALASVFATMTQRVYDLDKQYVDATSKFALFLRSIRSQIDPEARGGPTFDNSAELSRYLTSTLA